jgi:hypothetical protein
MTDNRPTPRDVPEIKLERFDLSTRTRNCLINQRVLTVGQLSDLTTSDIRAWPNAGRKTLRELQELLGSVGLKLRDDLEPVGTVKLSLLGELAAHAPRSLANDRPATPPTILLEHATPEIQKRLIAQLKLFSLSTRARNVVVQERLTYLGELVRLKHRDLCAFDHSGRRTANELVSLVQREGFQPGTTIPDWSSEAAAKLEAQFREEIQIEVVKRSSEFLAAIGPEPTCIEDELGRIAAALAADRNLDVIKRLWGWTGSEPRTLESVAQEQTPRLTRERIRQIEAKALRKLRQFKFDTTYLRAAIALLRKESPALATSLSTKLREHGLSRADFPVASVKVAAEILNLKWPLTDIAVGSERMLSLSDDEDRLVRLMQVLRRRTSELGCLSMVSLLSELGLPESKIGNIRAIIDVLPPVRWLDDQKTWLYVPESPRNRLLNLSAKVLGVCPRIRLSELRRAVAKSRRLSMAPPQKILGSFVQQIGLGRADGDMITANPGMVIVPRPETVEGKMLTVLDEHGPVMGGEDFADKCVAAGVNPITFYIYRLISPVVAALGNGIYCKVGAEVPIGLVEEIRSRRKATARVSDHGWMPNGNIWFGFKLSRSAITTGSVLLNSFVSDLVQGEWQARLPDGSNYDRVICRDVFITSFRKAFSVLGVEPDDFVALEFDHRSKIVVARAGGPDLFESMQETSPSDPIYEDDEGDEDNYAESNIDLHASRTSHAGTNGP